MKILVLKEAKIRKPDLITCAATEAFALNNDVVHVATIKVGSIIKTVSRIKELIKQFNPDIVVAQKMLASIVLFELPKSIKKIIFDPYLLIDDSDDEIKLALIMKYSSLRLNNWLNNAYRKFVSCPDETSIKNSYCIARNFMNHSSRYDKLVSVYTTAGNKNIFLGIEDGPDLIQNLSSCQQALNKARRYFDPDYELPDINALLNK